MNKLVILGFLAASATAVPTSVVNNVQLNRDLDCFEQENALFSCISVKTVSMLDRAARSSDIDIIDGVKFVRETPSEFQPLFVYQFLFNLRDPFKANHYTIFSVTSIVCKFARSSFV